MLCKVICSNYRSFEKDAIFNFDKGLNMIIGENNSGKTNFLRMLDIILNRLRNHTQIQSKAYIQNNNSDQFDIELPPDTNPLTEEEYFNKNIEEPISFGIVFNLEHDKNFFKDLKKVLYQTESSKRNFNNKIEIEKLNDASKKLGISFKIML